MVDQSSVPTQLLHLVIGGELRHPKEPVFRDLSQVEFVGAYGSYDEAKQAWKRAPRRPWTTPTCAISSCTPTS